VLTALRATDRVRFSADCCRSRIVRDKIGPGSRSEPPVVSNVTKEVQDGETIVATEIPTLPITDNDRNSTYRCKFGLKQKITDPSELTEAGLYHAKYAGNLDYQQWEKRKQDLDLAASELTIFEGVNDAGGIRFNDRFIPEPVKPENIGVDLSTVSGNENPGPLFTNYPTGGTRSPGEETGTNRNPLN